MTPDDALIEETARRRAAEARLRKVEALADESTPTPAVNTGDTFGYAAERIRAALAAEPAEACDTCDGMGRVEWEPGNQARGGRDDQPCPDCAEVTPPAEQQP